MNYTPPHQKKQVRNVTCILFVAAAAMYIFSALEITSPAILQFIMLILLCAGTYILIRYRYTTVSYSIRPRSTHSSDEYGDDLNILPPSMVDFAVSRAQGQRPSNLEVLISLDKLTESLPMEDGTKDALRKKYPGIKMYVHTVSLIRTQRLALVFDDEGELSCVIIEPNEAMSKYLTAVCEKNKSMEDKTI